jgi:hypothetical protein
MPKSLVPVFRVTGVGRAPSGAYNPAEIYLKKLPRNFLNGGAGPAWALAPPPSAKRVSSRPRGELALVQPSQAIVKMSLLVRRDPALPGFCPGMCWRNVTYLALEA